MSKLSVKKLKTLDLSKPPTKPKKQRNGLVPKNFTGIDARFGTGETHYENGRMTYCDDGNGNVWDDDEYDDSDIPF